MCVVCELVIVKPFRGRVLVYRRSGLTLAVSLTISQIFSVKEWRELENQVRGRSRSSSYEADVLRACKCG